MWAGTFKENSQTIARMIETEAESVGLGDLQLTPRQLEVFTMLDNGMIMADIARELKVTQARVRQIRVRLAWKIRKARKIAYRQNL